MKLILPSPLRARIEKQARASFPRECCGLIEGIGEGDTVQALTLHPARNIAVRADRFEIDPKDHFAALKNARANGHALIGCYHSHPHGQAVPSAHDLASAGEENFLWLIAALAGSGESVTLAAFVYSGAVFSPAEICAAGADLITSSVRARN